VEDNQTVVVVADFVCVASWSLLPDATQTMSSNLIRWFARRVRPFTSLAWASRSSRSFAEAWARC
jgi:hypothetical protein